MGTISTTERDASRWVSRPVWLKFELGEFQLFRLRLPFATLDAHFTELGDDPSRSWPGWQDLPPGVVGGLVRSHPVPGRLARKTVLPDCIRYVPYQYVRYYTEFGGAFEDYLAKFSRKSLKNRKHEISRFTGESGGSLDFRAYRTPSEVAEFFPLARGLSSKTFQERLLRAGLPESDEYLEHLLERARADKIRAFLLFFRGEAAAYLLNEVRDPGIVTVLYTGYDPKLKEWSPGTIAWFKALERMFTEPGLRMMDYTEGEGVHKRYFATGSRQCADVYFFRRTLGVHTLLAVHVLLQSVSVGIVSILARLGMKARVKRFIRAVASADWRSHR